MLLRFLHGGTGTSPPYGEGPAAPSARRAGVRRAGGQGLVARGAGRPGYGAVLTVILPSMISCLALSTAAMTSVILVKAGLDIDRATPSLSRP